jgi:hypothetical protein
MLDGALLANAAATAMVNTMTTDQWPAMRRELALVLALGEPTRAEAAEQQLERTKAEVGGAGPATADRVRDAHRAAWSARLEDVLARRPDLADALRAVLN